MVKQIRLSFDAERFEQAKKRAETLGERAKAFLAMTEKAYGLDVRDVIYRAFVYPLYSPGADFSRIEQFYTPELAHIVREMTDEAFEAEMPRLLSLRLDGPISSYLPARRCRTGHWAEYLPDLIELLTNLVHNYYFSGSLAEKLCGAPEEPALYEFSLEDYFAGTEYQLALSLRQREGEAEEIVRKAMQEGHADIPLSGKIIAGIVISGREDLVEALTILALHRDIPESLRQKILVRADMGTAKTFQMVLKGCLDRKAFSYSGAVKALEAWTGVPLGREKSPGAKIGARLAYEALTDDNKRKAFLESDDFLNVYLALWGYGCHEASEMKSLMESFLGDRKRSRRIVSWYLASAIENPVCQRQMAEEHLNEEDAETLAYITKCLPITGKLFQPFFSLNEDDTGGFRNPSLPQEKEERRRLFFELDELSSRIGNRKQVFEGLPFPGITAELDVKTAISCMMSLAAFDNDACLGREMKKRIPWMSVSQKQAMLRFFLSPANEPDDRETVGNLLTDRSGYVREEAEKVLGGCRLLPEEARKLSCALKTKSSSIRGTVMAVLMAQPEEILRDLISTLLKSQDKSKQQAGRELLEKSGIGKLEIKEPDEAGSLTRGCGFGLYAPGKVAAFEEQSYRAFSVVGEVQGAYSPMAEEEIRKIFPEEAFVDAIWHNMADIFERHRDYVYETAGPDGKSGSVLFGTSFHSFLPLPAGSPCSFAHEEQARLDMLPFSGEFREAFGDDAGRIDKIAGLYAVTDDYGRPLTPDGEYHTESWFVPIEEKNLSPMFWRPDIKEQHLRREAWFHQIIRLKLLEFGTHEVFALAFRLYRGLVAIVGEENLGRFYRRTEIFHDVGAVINHRMLGVWRHLIKTLSLSDEDFALWFSFEYRVEKLAGSVTTDGLGLDDYFRAIETGAAPVDVVMAHLMKEAPLEELQMPNGYLPMGDIPFLTGGGYHPSVLKAFYQRHPGAEEVARKVVDRIVTVEEERGDLPSEVTLQALNIERFEGAGHFLRLIAALGEEEFYRGYDGYAKSMKKPFVLSRLLRRCYPARSDTPESFRMLFRELKIREERLVEAAMYAPQWAGFVESALFWPGLECGAWFFHAHVGERFSAAKAVQAAGFSPFTPEQFNDGIFDRKWFFEAWQALGEKRFRLLYRYAKYVSQGPAGHRRAQLYADASLGKLDAETLLEEVKEKRNQDKLRAYALIPIKEGDASEVLKRYEFIRQFMKDSCRFGAKRQESERRAANAALQNLALTAGYQDADRLTWQMETEKTKRYRALFEPAAIEGYTVSLKVNEEGEAFVLAEKDGKALKTVPKALAGHAEAVSRANCAKELRAQKRRAVKIFEKAMAEQADFTAEEVSKLLDDPVLSPLSRSLLWESGGATGFPYPSEGSLMLKGARGEALPCGNVLRIAHPYGLRSAGGWEDFAHVLYDRRIRQPFKQVFREYYALTDDEREESAYSARYKGRPVMAGTFLAVLKSRGWAPDDEVGPRKVFDKEGIVVTMLGDDSSWRAPLEGEELPVGEVEFSRRKDFSDIPLADVPPVLFSEAMRDLDMAISAASSGSAYHEDSRPVMEIRAALVNETARMAGLKNVSLDEEHALIRGKAGEWSVHLGTGAVCGESQGTGDIPDRKRSSRSGLFLPFAEDDKKTAEILSRILQLSAM